MNENHRKAVFRFELGLCLTGAFLAWALFYNHSLPFPLSAQDQAQVLSALGKTAGPVENGWITALADRLLGRLFPSDPYFALQHLRLLAALLAVVGSAVWAWRSAGGIFGIWVALLSVGFLPLQIAGTTLAPQAFCLALLVWGGQLSLGRPWSKTGTAEQFGGGILLGMACFAAPWGFLYGAGVPLRAALSSSYRRRLESPFWVGFLLGLFPGVIWASRLEESLGWVLGFRPETLNWTKAGQLAELATQELGLCLLFFILVGAYASRVEVSDERSWIIDLAWPAIPSLAFGYADSLRLSLAFPGLIFLAAWGVEWTGHLFVNKTERKWLSTFLALALGYHSFFGAGPILRERQAHSAEVADLAHLLSEEVPEGDAVALFRLNSLADYLKALKPDHSWRVLEKSRFPANPNEVWEGFWLAQVGEGARLWIDPKRLAEPVEGLGPDYAETLESRIGPGGAHQKGQAILWMLARDSRSR